MSIGLEVSLAALGVSLIGVTISLLNHASARRKRREEQMLRDFMETRRYLKARRGALSEASIASQDKFQWDQHIPLLTKPGWIPSRPLPLAEVSVRLRAAKPEEQDAIVKARLKTLAYWPRGNDGHRLTRYSQAIVEHDTETRMEDRSCYRLIDVRFDSQSNPSCELIFTQATYFDGIDTGESLAHEAALRMSKKHKAPLSGPYRTWLADPFRLDARAALPGINTLTVCLSRGEPSIYMHRRGFNAGVSMGGFNVAPAGEFQPQIDDPTIWQSDLDILKNIIREYAEEFLGMDEAAGSGGVTIDYQNDRPYSDFYEAFLADKMKVFYLGIGLDPVSWKPEILTACVFEQAAFDRIFRDMVTDKIDQGTGGVLLVGRSRKGSRGPGRRFGGFPLLTPSAAPFLDPGQTLPAGVGCMALVRRWQSDILS
jgi:hypothetical protein